MQEETHQQSNHQQLRTESEGIEVKLTQPRTYLETQLNSGEITLNKQLNKSKRKPQTLYTWKNQLQHNLPTPAQEKTRGGGQTD